MLAISQMISLCLNAQNRVVGGARGAGDIFDNSPLPFNQFQQLFQLMVSLARQSCLLPDQSAIKVQRLPGGLLYGELKGGFPCRLR